MYRKAILNRKWTNLRGSPSNGPKTTSVNQQGGELVTLEKSSVVPKITVTRRTTAGVSKERIQLQMAGVTSPAAMIPATAAHEMTRFNAIRRMDRRSWATTSYNDSKTNNPKPN